ERSELADALSGLIRAYIAGTPEAVLEFMEGRGEKLSPPSVDAFRKMLIDETGMKAASVNNLNDKEVFLKYASLIHIQSHWESLVPSEGCVQYWKAAKPRT